ncbi:MAG: class I SAM-dependent methyltransferase [Alphaproteobacteria bacterium]|nr:class I SAM-dependent methyltransferase [Alphaproteobacteria bacterium]
MFLLSKHTNVGKRIALAVVPGRHGGVGAAVAIAGRQPKARLFATDIADQAISRNQAAAKEQGYANLEFILTDGRNIDFADAMFDGVCCRYALHHFPDINATLADVRRVLKPGASFTVADVVRHPNDDQDFINQFQALKPDGHVRMRTADALFDLLRRHGFAAAARFSSKISFTRQLNAAYRDLIDATPPEILALYDVEIAGGQAALTFDILNVRFVASGAVR